MSQKKGDIVVLMPGAAGWEAWSGPTAGPYELVEATETVRAGDLGRLPSGDVVLLFPVRAVTAVPFRGATTDDDLFGDVAAMHIERLGLRPDENAGQLIDSFVVARGEDETQLLTLVLRAPGEGDLPARSPKEFDLSARALPVPASGVAVWRELGRWVFAIGGVDGALAYVQATPCAGPLPDDSVAGEISLALTQLALQRMPVNPQRVVIWTEDEPVGHPEALEQAFPGRVATEPRPAPTLPTPRSRLLPEDVRAARRERASQRRKIAIGTAAALAYCGLIGWLVFGLVRDLGIAKKLAAAAESMRPVTEAFESHRSRWDDLAPVVDTDGWPIQLLFRCVRQIPPNSGLRLQTAELSGDDAGRIKQIRLVGEAREPGPIQQFSLALNRNDQLAVFQWELPPPQQTNKGNWSFTFTGVRQDAPTP
jgi:hypothetical protein